MEQSTINIDELERLAKAATPGPWSQAGFRVTAKELGYDRVADTEFDNDSMAENAAFIAAANPTTITAMIDSLHKANGRLHEVATHCANVEAERDEAKMRVQILERNLRDAEEAGRRLAKQAHQAEQERDALAAKLKGLEGQEPLFWYRPCGEMYEGPVHHNSIGGKMLRDEKPGEWKPLFSRPVPAEPVNARLLNIARQAVGMIENTSIETGFCCCGDGMVGHDSPMECGHSAIDQGAYLANELHKDALEAIASAAEAHQPEPVRLTIEQIQRIADAVEISSANLPGMISAFHRDEQRICATPEPAPTTARPTCGSDYVFRELVNDLRDIALKWHPSQQLRERISGRLRENVRPTGDQGNPAPAKLTTMEMNSLLLRHKESCYGEFEFVERIQEAVLKKNGLTHDSDANPPTAALAPAPVIGLTIREGDFEANVHGVENGTVLYGLYRYGCEFPVALHRATLAQWSRMSAKALDEGAFSYTNVRPMAELDARG